MFWISCFNTASGKHCCNVVTQPQQSTGLWVSIPQAVSTVATGNKITEDEYTYECFNTASGKHCCNCRQLHYGNRYRLLVSIPQAVSTVATDDLRRAKSLSIKGFNTASGKHCCNLYTARSTNILLTVSIPQAVSTVATRKKMQTLKVLLKFQYRKR